MINSENSFKIALIGRPNVGKSSLFNRLAGKKLAIVDNTPGVTRDVKTAPAKIGKTEFMIMDTAGYEKGDAESLATRLWQSTLYALDMADAAIFMLSAHDGITPLDVEFANILRTHGIKNIIVCVNKFERGDDSAMVGEAYSLGFKTVLGISTVQGLGMQELEASIKSCIKAQTLENEEFEEDLDSELDKDPNMPYLQLAIVGRPNAGKSTMVNKLIKEDRLVTGAEAGITRDSITIPMLHNNRLFNIIDTAGVRRQAKIDDFLEKLSVTDTFRAIQYAQVVALLIDAKLGLDKQDLTIARKVIEEGRCLIIVLNKWDAVQDQSKVLSEVNDRLETSLAQVKKVSVITTSGLYGNGLKKLLDEAFRIYEKWDSRITTSKLNQFLEYIISKNPPPIVGGRRIKIRYITQAKKRPPTFVLNGTKGDDLPDSYYRYIQNELYKAFDMWGVPLRIIYRTNENPFDK